jgi:two-component system response regulator AtoC
MSLVDAVVLVVDPERDSREALTSLLLRRGSRPVACSEGAAALELLNKEPVDIVVTELALEDMTALSFVAAVEERWPGLPTIVIAGGASVSDAVGALRAGAADFVEKPFDAEGVSYVLGKALTAVRSRAMRPPPPSSGARAGILGDSQAMQQAYATLQRAAQSSATVLVRGESGTGKELVARAIHESSPRASQPFVKIDCTAFPETLLDSELFGYERGAFTGAASRKPGRVELADKGTLFLDEIGELTLPLQAKLLRLLQDRKFERLGGTKTIDVDVRFVAATHRDLENMVERKQFRLDLFYRLNVVPLWLPPLRARREDIEPLAQHFCRTFASANGKYNVTLDASALRFFRSQRWPGNVRQLQNFVERLVVLAPGPVIREEDVKAELLQATFKTQTSMVESHLATELTGPPSTQAEPSAPESVAGTLEAALRAAEKRALERALRHCNGNRSQAARVLGVSRSTLYAKLMEHGLL